MNLNDIYEICIDRNLELLIRNDVRTGEYFVHLYHVINRSGKETIYIAYSNSLSELLTKVRRILNDKN